MILFATSLLLVACSSGDDQTTSKQSDKNRVLESQMQALEKAKAAEQMLQSGADSRQQAIEEQSR
ncbi:MAG: hypothetical protein OEL79_02595 [Chromatiales bacterium]|nr:hypothetical protein [Chromatiales bacterium]